MSTALSEAFLRDLAQVYRTIQQQTLSPGFLADQAQVHASLPVATATSLRLLADRFDKWRRATEALVRSRLARVAKDDPLLCPISLFRTMDCGRLETAHTRTLAWLLDPRREHGFGSALLAALMSRLSGGASTSGIRVERVESEFPIDASGGQGRLDVLAEGLWENGNRLGWVLAIEAKVDAAESEDQLQRYETWLECNAVGRDVFRMFLTPEGRAPETAANQWESLSHLELVRVFRTVYHGLRQAAGFHFLRFYLAGVLQDICHLPCDFGEELADPYAAASYLKSVHDPCSEGENHDCPR